MNKKVKSLVWGAGILGFGFSAVAAATYLFTDALVDVALERNGIDKFKQTPKTKKIITGIEDNEITRAFMQSRAESSSKLDKVEMEDVKITAYDGIELVGKLYKCKEPKRVIIAMHGWRSSYGEDFGLISKFFHENNCNVLYACQRGQGESGGDHMGFGLIERYDCLEWVKFIDSQFELPIYLAGVSMGASTVLMASSLQMPESVKGIIADCGFTSPEKIWKHIANKNMKLSYGIIGKIADDMCKRKIQIGPDDFSVTEAMKENKIPVLFIHGTDDHFVPVTMTYENYKACTSPKKLLVIPGADHAMSYYINPALYEKTLSEFWSEYDII